jgi:TonB family protein
MIGEQYYPIESRRLREEGQCRVGIRVDKFGRIHDPQIVTSSGFERLDTACIAALSGGHLIPATKDGIPVESTTTLPINWVLRKDPVSSVEVPGLSACMNGVSANAATIAGMAVPVTSNDSSRQKLSESAKVILQLFVSATGSIQGAAVLQSSGSPRLDEAALKGVRGQSLIPAAQNGVPVAACVRMPIVFKFQ